MVENSKRKLYDGYQINDFRELINVRYTMFKDKNAFEYRLKPDSEIIKVTYSDYINDIKALGTALLNLGLEKKRIALIAPNRYEWCVSYLAVTTSNIVVVPLDKSLPDNEIESLIIRSKVDGVIFDKKYLDVFNNIKNNNTSNLTTYICMDYSEDKDNILSYPKLINNGAKLLANGDKKYDNITIDNTAMSIMIFTSGTTSISKAVMLSQKNICSDIYSLSCMAKVTSNDKFLSFLPLHHTFESTCTFLYGTSAGITVVFTDGLKYIVKNLKEYEITGFVCVPLVLETIYKKINKEIEKQGKTKLIKFARKFSNFLLKFHIDIRKKIFKPILDQLGGKLNILIAGGAPMDKEAISAFVDFGINLLQGYGLTETSPVAAGENDKYKRAGSVGFPLPNIDIEIDNPDEDGVGEIIIKAPTVMLGYYENPEATDSVLRDSWFHTGDLGKFDEDGFLFVTGRKKFVIVLKNGKKVFPEEVEILINKLPFVQESMVYGLPDRDNDVKLCAKIVYNPDTMKELYPASRESDYKKLIKDQIKKINHTMPAYKYIRDIIITTEPLIKTTTQKIKRNEEMKKIIGK